MPTTTPIPGDTRALLLDRVGAGGPGGTTVDQAVDAAVRDVATKWIDKVWAKYANLAAIDPELQELYTLRYLIDLISGQVRARPNVSGDGKTVSWQDRLAALQTLRGDVQSEIDSLWSIVRARRSVVAGTISQPSPMVAPNAGAIGDPNDSRLRGDPFRPPFLPWGY